MTYFRVGPYIFGDRSLAPVVMDETWPEMATNTGLNLYEESDAVVVEAAVPGVPEDKINITIEDGVLHIQGKNEEVEEEKKKRVIVHKMERSTSFHYTTYLPRPVDQNKIEAHLKDGVLRVRAPLAESAKPKKIAVKSVNTK